MVPREIILRKHQKARSKIGHEPNEDHAERSNSARRIKLHEIYHLRGGSHLRSHALAGANL